MNLKEALGDSLAGRIEIKYLPPCCFGEQFGSQEGNILEDLSYSAQKIAKRNLTEYLTYGGFPELLEDENHDQKSNILKNYKNTYFTRDLSLMANLENIEGLKAIFHALIRGVGSRYEYTSIQKESSLSYATVKKYINVLNSAGLTFKLYAYHLGAAKRYISSSKTYFIDNGIINAISDESSKGQLFENLVISEIEKRRQIGEIDCDELYYYQSLGGREIDLIIEEKNQITAIEVKSSISITGRDIRNLREFTIKSPKPLRKWIIYAGDKMYQEGGILILPFLHFFRRKYA
jgi:predicted AAA+ superfamily ATPase